MTLSQPIDHPVGIRKFGSDSVLIVEGGGVGRLSLIQISGDAGQLTTLKEGYPDGAVSVTVVGNTAYVLEGQLKILFGSDEQTPKKPFHATDVAVGRP